MGHSSERPLEGIDDLLEPFYAAEKPRAAWRIGTEAEKFGIVRETGAPIAFDGDRGVRAVLLELRDRHGWFEEPEVAGGEIIALRRGDASITLEPGGQLELSGAPLATVHQTCAEFRGHMSELRDISTELGIAWLGLGFHPFARQEDLPWVPKLRYAIMRDYLPTKGSMALDMMRRTATVQANLDYSSEDDAVRKMRVALAISPILTAMFANSPFSEGALNGDRSRRGRVWMHVDPDRTGLLPFAWQDGFGYQRYVEYALGVPMFLIKRDGKPIANTGQTFASFLKEGFQGHRATMDDWKMHLNTLFPDVRLKNIIEVRSADSQRTALICALPAVLKGVLYEDTSLTAVETMIAGLTYADANAAREDVPERGLRATMRGREMGEWASELLGHAEDGLARLSNLNRHGEDERIHLTALRGLMDRGMSPADELLEAIDMTQPLGGQLLEHAMV
ncbi:MAG: glutamate--cysteine ligase [Sandaracinaceae bacterium]